MREYGMKRNKAKKRNQITKLIQKQKKLSCRENSLLKSLFMLQNMKKNFIGGAWY